MVNFWLVEDVHWDNAMLCTVASVTALGAAVQSINATLALRYTKKPVGSVCNTQGIPPGFH